MQQLFVLLIIILQPVLLVANSSKVRTDSLPPIEGWVTIAEEMPRFPGCEDLEGSIQEKKRYADQKLLHYIYNNWRVPPIAIEKQVCESIILSFIVDKQGKIREVTVLKEPGYEMGASMAKVIQAMNELPPWRPGQLNGEAVAVKYMFPVRYHLK